MSVSIAVSAQMASVKTLRDLSDVFVAKAINCPQQEISVKVGSMTDTFSSSNNMYRITDNGRIVYIAFEVLKLYSQTGCGVSRTFLPF